MKKCPGPTWGRGSEYSRKPSSRLHLWSTRTLQGSSSDFVQQPFTHFWWAEAGRPWDLRLHTTQSGAKLLQIKIHNTFLDLELNLLKLKHHFSYLIISFLDWIQEIVNKFTHQPYRHFANSSKRAKPENNKKKYTYYKRTSCYSKFRGPSSCHQIWSP